MLRPRDKDKDFIAVIDCETTGLGKTDRIIEIAVLFVDITSGNLGDVGTFTTLINPECDVGPTHIHKITNEMAACAPTFDQVAGPLAEALDGTILAAHNLPFDGRMLQQDFKRVGVNFSKGWGICTYQLTGLSLSEACKEFGITQTGAHIALGDAIATAELMALLIAGTEIEGDYATATNYEHLLPSNHKPVDRLQAKEEARKQGREARRQERSVRRQERSERKQERAARRQERRNRRK